MELNNTDESILEELDQERCTPRYLAEELSRSRAYINQRLTHLRDEEYVERVSRGLYRRAESAESVLPDQRNQLN